MFEIKINIHTPDNKLTTIGKCNDTLCITQRGDRHGICNHCPIWIKDREHQTELKNVHERVRNVFYVQKNIAEGIFLKVNTKQAEDAIDRIFEEKPIEGLK